jgi:hypothetical protein
MKQKLSPKEQLYCYNVALKTAKYFGWDISKSSNFNHGLWIFLPEKKNLKKCPFWYRGSVHTDRPRDSFDFDGDEINSHNWVVIVELLEWFGERYIPTDLIAAVSLIERHITEDTRKPLALT